MTETGTPARMRFRMPGEWEPHRAVWVAYPYNAAHYDNLAAAQQEWLQMVDLLASAELVNIVVHSHNAADSLGQRIRDQGTNMQRIYLHVMEHKDVWLRDSGPTFLKQRDGKRIGAVHWTFDGWGEGFVDVADDDALSRDIAEQLDCDSFEPGIICEGGAIESNGIDTLLTTEPVMARRNPGKSKRVAESFLREYTGMRQVLWLPGILASDDTGGHIDNLARFVAPRTILAPRSSATHPDHTPLEMNYSVLKHARDTEGTPFELLSLPHPDPISNGEKVLCATYANFYISNRIVIVPQFGVSADQDALDVLQAVLPDRTVVGWNGLHMLSGGGGVHCLTQPQFS